MVHTIAEDVPSHLEFEHFTCPARYCNHRSAPQCEKDCDLYLEFKERFIELAAEVFN